VINNGSLAFFFIFYFFSQFCGLESLAIFFKILSILGWSNLHFKKKEKFPTIFNFFWLASGENSSQKIWSLIMNKNIILHIIKLI
jgi:hypothetical protein